MRYLERPDTALDILECEKPKLGGLVTQPILHLIMDGSGNHNSTRAGEFLEPGCNIDPVPVDVALFNDNVADICRHPQLQRIASAR